VTTLSDSAAAGAVAAYLPVPLGACCNAGVDVLEPGATPLLGETALRGLPFAVESDPARCFVGLGSGMAGAASIPLRRTARWVVFAHRLVEPLRDEAANLGRPVAELSFVYAEDAPRR